MSAERTPNECSLTRRAIRVNILYDALARRVGPQVRRILDVVPDSIHDKCPIIMGCARDCSAVLASYAMSSAPASWAVMG